MRNDVDTMIADFLLRRWRAEEPNSYDAADGHLRTCLAAAVTEIDARNGSYGCDTGCEYVRLEATILCLHGEMLTYTYGDFGDLADLLVEVEEDQARHGRPQVTDLGHVEPGTTLQLPGPGTFIWTE
jgi:hypothetical protein